MHSRVIFPHKPFTTPPLTCGPELCPWLGQLVYPPGPCGRGRALPASGGAAAPGHQAGLEGELLPHLSLGAPQHSLLGHLGVGSAQLEGPAQAAAQCLCCSNRTICNTYLCENSLVGVQSTACLGNLEWIAVTVEALQHEARQLQGQQMGPGSSMALWLWNVIILSTHSKCPSASRPCVGRPSTTSLRVSPACLCHQSILPQLGGLAHATRWRALSSEVSVSPTAGPRHSRWGTHPRQRLLPPPQTCPGITLLAGLPGEGLS